jgi:hypothetical protein
MGRKRLTVCVQQLSATQLKESKRLDPEIRLLELPAR